MFDYKLLLILNEGLTFGIFAIGIYIAFQWLKFPDLTPDGSFVIGSCVYIKLVIIGYPIPVAIILGMLSGFMSGGITAILNIIIKIPSVVAGLITSIALYSTSWLILGKPNQILVDKATLITNTTSIHGAFNMFVIFMSVFLLIVIIVYLFGDSLFGLRLRAIGENPLLSKDLKKSNFFIHFIGLGVANSLVSLAGILFCQRSYTVDINMGIGQTIIGLIAMIIGLLISIKSRKIFIILLSIGIGAVLHKTVIFFSLEAGLPAESFRLISALFFIILFIIIKTSSVNFLRGLKWS